MQVEGDTLEVGVMKDNGSIDEQESFSQAALAVARNANLDDPRQHLHTRRACGDSAR